MQAHRTPSAQHDAAFRAWLERVAATPYRFDFYQVLRHIEAAHPDLPRLGEAARPADEPVRVAQPAELAFAPASLHALETDRGVPRLQQRIFGLLGPQGPLPTHLTELARERLQHHADPTLQRFLDLFTHRFALLFYRAWAQAQPTLALDRPGDAGFGRWLASLVGVGSETLAQRDALGDAAKLHFAGRLVRPTRDAEGLQAWCRSTFGVPLRIEPWRGHWMALDHEERTRLSTRLGQPVGQGAVLGASVWDVQHKFRIVIGPLTMERYRDFLPDGRDLPRLQALVRQWVGLEFDWDLQLVLVRAEVPPVRLGRRGSTQPPSRLGRTAWLGTYRTARDAGDLCMNVESALRRRGRPRSPAAPHPRPATSPLS
jgi:type VI secretion system protein ImpH